MNILGLDLSLAQTGVAVPGRTFVIVGHGAGPERLGAIRRGLVATVREVDADLAVVEGYAFSAHMAGARAIGELGGVIRLALYDLNVPFVEVPPASLKLFAADNGRAKKPEMLSAALALQPLDLTTYDDNEVDAWWLRRVGLCIVGKVIPTDYQRRALAKVVVPNGVRRLAMLGGAR